MANAQTLTVPKKSWFTTSKEREAYEVIVENGKLVHMQSGMLVDTVEESKWIFVLSTSRSLYVGQKKRRNFSALKLCF
ncbi:hypothetical protein ACFX2F_043043 [Malus domestica]